MEILRSCSFQMTSAQRKNSGRALTLGVIFPLLARILWGHGTVYGKSMGFEAQMMGLESQFCPKCVALGK